MAEVWTAIKTLFTAIGEIVDFKLIWDYIVKGIDKLIALF